MDLFQIKRQIQNENTYLQPFHIGWKLSTRRAACDCKQHFFFFSEETKSSVSGSEEPLWDTRHDVTSHIGWADCSGNTFLNSYWLLSQTMRFALISKRTIFLSRTGTGHKTFSLEHGLYVTTFRTLDTGKNSYWDFPFFFIEPLPLPLLVSLGD